jgi:hypothetical protein
MVRDPSIHAQHIQRVHGVKGGPSQSTSRDNGKVVDGFGYEYDPFED